MSDPFLFEPEAHDSDRMRADLWEKIGEGEKNGDFTQLFLKGGCLFFASILNEKLRLPLFYFSHTEDRYAHVFVKDAAKCYDYSGETTVDALAKTYIGYLCVPKQMEPGDILLAIRRKNLGDDLESRLFEIANSEFSKRREKYPHP